MFPESSTTLSDLQWLKCTVTAFTVPLQGYLYPVLLFMVSSDLPCSLENPCLILRLVYISLPQKFILPVYFSFILTNNSVLEMLFHFLGTSDGEFLCFVPRNVCPTDHINNICQKPRCEQ
jgi:hypothetical protein